MPHGIEDIIKNEPSKESLKETGNRNNCHDV